MFRKLISRRDLLGRYIGSAVCFTSTRSEGQIATADDRPVPLEREIKSSTLLDLSPDGTKVCLYFTTHSTRSFVWRGEWKEKTAPVKSGEDALRVFDTGSWTSKYAVRLPAMPHHGSFFADSDALYVEVPGASGGQTLHAVIDLRTGKNDEVFSPYRGHELAFSYRALTSGVLLGSGRNPDTAHTEVLVRAELPSYREIKRVAYAGRRSSSTGLTEAPIAITPNRKAFVSSYDNNVVCRETNSLEILWSRKTDPELPLFQLAISADASLAAASASNRAGISSINLLDGKDGREVLKLPVDGTEGLAISPDNRLLVAGQRIALSGRTSGTRPTLVIFDIPSGKKVSTIVQDEFRGGGKEFLYAGFAINGIQFLPNGNRLIASGRNTKIWELGPSGNVNGEKHPAV